MFFNVLYPPTSAMKRWLTITDPPYGEARGVIYWTRLRNYYHIQETQEWTTDK